jgi:hypothetical protein
MKLPQNIALSVSLALVSASGLHAQTTNSTATPTPPPTVSGSSTSAAPTTTKPAAAATMSTIVVNGSTEGSVLPTDTPVDSVFGNDMSVQDTPRSVTQVSAQLLSDANIQNLADFVKVAPSAYSTDQFGIPSVPVIRGQLAEVYINGMQRTTRGDGPPTNFNAVESANVVAGPATSVYGPTANVGGYIDFITKQPYFDKFHSETDFTVGSYDTKRWTEDFGGPITKDLAYRVSYQGDYSGSYYNGIKTQENDFFLALAWVPNSDFRVDFNTDFQVGNFNENTGWNRPTQALIDNHTYTTGPTTGGFGGVITGTTGTRLSDSTTLISPNDSDYGKDINAELKETYTANDNLSFVNHTYYEYFELRNSEFAQLYVNSQQSNIVQDRFEAHINFDVPIGGSSSSGDPKTMKDSKAMAQIDPPVDLKNEIVTGVAAKYVNALGYGDFFNEYLNQTDLSAAGVFPTVNNQTNGTNFDSLGAVPGKNFFATTGTDQPNTYTEEAEEASAFFQHQISYMQWTLIYSGRMDAIFDDVGNPVFDNGNPGFGVPPNPSSQNKYTTSQVLGTGDISVSYKPAEWVTAYTTFDFNESTSGNSAGGFDDYAGGGSSADYHYKNYLYEGGLKFDLLNHTLYSTVDGYYQNHNVTTAIGTTSQVRTVGAEISTTYQPDKHFYLTANESYLNSTVVDPGAEFTQNVYDAFAPGSIDAAGTGVGSPNFLKLPNGHYREAGLPQFLLTGSANYKLDCGVGASLSYVITDPIPTSELANVWIPWQYEIDATLFYNYNKNFGAKITFFNVTDQHNFSTGGYPNSSGNDLITIHEPFHMEGTISYKF